jgi:hypothetical protein
MYYSTSRLPLGNQYVFPNNPRLPPWKFYVFYRKITKRDDSVDAGDDSSTTPIKRSRLATCFVAHLDHAIVDGGSLSMTIMPKLLDFDDESTDPTAMFQNLRPFTRFQRALMNVQGFLLIPLAVYRASLPGNDARGDANPLHDQECKTEGR